MNILKRFAILLAVTAGSLVTATAPIDVTFVIRNTGKYDGDEVAQVYVRLPEYEGKAPLKELKGFSRVHLKKGESKVVTVPVRREDLRYWSEEKECFVILEGLPKIFVGSSSADIRLEY